MSLPAGFHTLKAYAQSDYLALDEHQRWVKLCLGCRYDFGRGRESFALVSAFNPQSEARPLFDNLCADRLLREGLLEHQIPFFRAYAGLSPWLELGYLVFAPLSVIDALAMSLNQAAVVAGDDETPLRLRIFRPGWIKAVSNLESYGFDQRWFEFPGVDTYVEPEPTASASEQSAEDDESAIETSESTPVEEDPSVDAEAPSVEDVDADPRVANEALQTDSEPVATEPALELAVVTEAVSGEAISAEPVSAPN
jgi:hypothetical protein